MKKQTFSLLAGAVLAVALLLVPAIFRYEVTKVEGGRIPMNSVSGCRAGCRSRGSAGALQGPDGPRYVSCGGNRRNVDEQIPARKPFIQSDCRCTA